eukprot:12272134-Heterocapsa_arctica.AAC.1
MGHPIVPETGSTPFPDSTSSLLPGTAPFAGDLTTLPQDAVPYNGRRVLPSSWFLSSNNSYCAYIQHPTDPAILGMVYVHPHTLIQDFFEEACRLASFTPNAQ